MAKLFFINHASWFKFIPLISAIFSAIKIEYLKKHSNPMLKVNPQKIKIHIEKFFFLKTLYKLNNLFKIDENNKKKYADTTDCKNKVKKQILKLPLIFEKTLLKKEIKKKNR